MTPCRQYQFSGKPFLLGLTIPNHSRLTVSSAEPAIDMVQHALERGFDFLLVPQSLAPEFTHAEIARCAIPGKSQDYPICGRGDIDARDLIWLGLPLLSAEGGVIVSTNMEGFDRKQAPLLREQLAAVRAVGGGQGERCVLLEIELDAAADMSGSDEDDALEGFIFSLGKTSPITDPGIASTTAKRLIDREALHQFLLFVQGVGYNGVSLVLADPLTDLDSIDRPLLRAAQALQ